MAVVVSIARGHDASYPFKTTGAADGPVITGQRGAGYYRSAVKKGGEPAETRQLGLEWAYRTASKGRAIAGFHEKPIAQFSSRRAQITKTTLAEQYEKDRGHALDQRVLASMGRFANAMTGRAKGPAALHFTALLRGWNVPRVWPSLRRCVTSRERYGAEHHALAPPRERVPTHAQNSYGGPGGSRRAGNSRMRKNVRSWPSVSRGRKRRLSRGLARILFTALTSTCPTTLVAGTRRTPGSSSKDSSQGAGGGGRGRGGSAGCSRMVASPRRCAARTAAKRERGWRLDGRSG